MTATTAASSMQPPGPDLNAPSRWWVAQLGAREHYAAARAFAQAGTLGGLYTDFWCRWGHPLLRRGPRQLRGIAGRYHPDIPSSRVVDFKFSMWRHGREGNRYDRYVDAGAAFGRKVRDHLSRQGLDRSRDAFFGYCTGCLEALEMLRDRGVTTIVDQIDPARVEEQIILEEQQRWPGWEAQMERATESYWERLRAEWSAASVVLVNSDWTAQALVTQGVPRERCEVVPLAYEPPQDASTLARRRTGHDRPLTVLWLGNVMLRKGIPYLFEAARLLASAKIRFIVAGDIFINPPAVASAPPNVQVIGRVSRDETAKWYQQADVFVLPTLSDGFAITQLEAMSYGLPVITTSRCGDVVSDGVDGLVVPVRDPRAIAEAILKLNGNSDLLEAMSRAAIAKSGEFGLGRYYRALCQLASRR